MIDTTAFACEGRTERPVVAEATIDASPAEVFDAWTTSAILAEWLGVEANVELRVGGPFELYFAADAPAGDRGSEDCQILGYVPDELLIVSWNSPPTLPEIRKAHTQVGIRLTPDESGTHVRIVHTGMGDTDIWDQNRSYFESAWPSVLRALQAHFD